MRSVTEKPLSLPLTLSLADALRLCPWFVPAKATKDRLQLGWRLANPGRWPEISAGRLIGCSAEAAAVLAAMRAAFPTPERSLTTWRGNASPWDRVLNGLWPERGSWEALSTGEAALLGREVDVTHKVSVEIVANSIVADLLNLPGEAGRQLSPAREVLRRLITEALLNVSEHAYSRDARARAWVSAVSLPPLTHQTLYSDRGFLGDSERAWFKRIADQTVLEIGIADIGVGIPESLAPAAEKIVPRLATTARKLASGRSRFATYRSQIHADLCDHAFRHFSTRKQREEFATEYHRLNWRGLYRCYRQITELGGAISVTSGRGRAGYVATTTGAERFDVALPAKSDVPGTLVTLRFPLPLRRRASLPAVGASVATLTVDHPPMGWIDLDDVPSQVASSHAASDIAPSETTTFVAVALPFVDITDEPDVAEEHRLSLQRVRVGIEHLSQHLVPIFSFGTLIEGWRDALRALVRSDQWRSAIDGPPRLVGWLDDNEIVHWVFAGAAPDEVDEPLKAFETNGSWTLSPDSPDVVRAFFGELRAHYPSVIAWDKQTRVLQLLPFGARLGREPRDAAIAKAFEQYWQLSSVRNEVITDLPGRVIVLPTGTRVQRHFSVFQLLHGAPRLTLTLGRVFGDFVREVDASGRAMVVLDRAASRFIAHALLEGADVEPEVKTLDELTNIQPERQSVLLFADAIFFGRTVERMVEALERRGFQVTRIVTCADLRQNREPTDINGVSLSSLVSPLFDAEAVPDAAGAEEVQTDALTNVPMRETASTFIELTNHEGRRALLESQPELFCAGFHVRGGRTHSFALPVQNLLRLNAGEELVTGWICESLRSQLDAIGFQVAQRDVVIFSWFDTAISKIVEHVGTRLRQPPFAAERTFSVKMPVAHRGADMVYPRAGSNPLVGCTEIATGRFSFANRRQPRPGFLAVYLAQSAVSGNSLREFLHRMTTAAAPQAGAVIALTAINRLSPAEVRFFQLCRTLAADVGRSLPFAYTYLFTLQIRSHTGTGPIRNELLELLLNDAAIQVGELRDYVEAIRTRTNGLSSATCLRHLFYPLDVQEPVSYDAVRLRHLLALNQQNEPVVLEIIALLQQLTVPDHEDFSILTMFALEPGLLLEPPLRQFGRELLVRSAVRALRQPATSIPCKSDALAVLATYRGALRHHFHELAKTVLSDEHLRRQAVALLLVQQLDSNDSAVAIIESSYPRLTPSLRERAEQLCHLTAVCTSIQNKNHSPRREDEFTAVIKRLGSRMLPHTTDMEDDWDDVGTSLSNLATYWRKLASTERRIATVALARRAIIVAEDTLLPAFPALSYFAQARGLHDLASSLNDDYVRAHAQLSEFKRQLPSAPQHMTQKQALALDQSFSRLRRSTWLAPTSERVLRGDAVDADSGPLVQALPRLFASPTNLLVRVTEEVLGVSKSIMQLQEMGARPSSPQLTVCPVPSAELRHIYKLLLMNIQAYGDLSSVRATSDLQLEADGTKVWSVEIMNSIRNGPRPGHGAGIATATRHATQFGVAVVSQPHSKLVWRTHIRVPRCFHLHDLAGLRETL